MFNPVYIRYAVPKGDPANFLPVLDRELVKGMEKQEGVYRSAMVKWFGQGKISAFPPPLAEKCTSGHHCVDGIFSCFDIFTQKAGGSKYEGV